MTSAGFSADLNAPAAPRRRGWAFSTLGTALLRKLPPNTAHQMAVKALKYRLLPSSPPPANEALRQELWGIEFTNPLGMSAGFDKNAEAIAGLFGMGFGFVEAGTVTPLPQPGNPRPNLFRLEEDKALINRLGFPSKGLDYFVRKLAARPVEICGPTGANVGINTGTDDAVRDVTQCLERVVPFADYLVVNISCPNTPGLCEWQTPDGLGQMIETARDVRARFAGPTPPPILVKLSADLELPLVESLSHTALEANVDGLIASNTTVTRPETLQSANASQAGGLSGPPLAKASYQMLHNLYRITEGKIPLIASGGIANADDAYQRIRGGASLVQVYTALVYAGPVLVTDILTGLTRRLKQDGFASIEEAVGADHR